MTSKRVARICQHQLSFLLLNRLYWYWQSFLADVHVVHEVLSKCSC